MPPHNLESSSPPPAVHGRSTKKTGKGGGPSHPTGAFSLLLLLPLLLIFDPVVKDYTTQTSMSRRKGNNIKEQLGLDDMDGGGYNALQQDYLKRHSSGSGVGNKSLNTDQPLFRALR